MCSSDLITNFKCIPVHPLTRKPACGAEATATIKTSDFGMTPRGPDTDHIAISVVIEALLFRNRCGVGEYRLDAS